MTYTRLDKACRATVLGKYNDRVLIEASWPATGQDKKKFMVSPGGIAHNIVEVSKDYFNRKYGAKL